jgi:restriction endonuclease S subunit
MLKRKKKNLTKKEIEKLLDKQTSIILTAVDRKILKIERKITKLEAKVEQRFDQLITTLDKFLKRLTDLEDEFTMMKVDIRRIKAVIKEKLGVDLD